MLKHLVLASGLMLAGWGLAGCATAESSIATEAPGLSAPAAELAAMPEAVTSFGAVTDAGLLYVFGGHRGERHEYNADMVSGAFHRLRLSEGRRWERLPEATPAQGVPLVAHAGRIYRLGGMAARNPAGSRQDLVSTDLVQRFDPRAGRWEDFRPLPAPRSSHDAVVLGDRLFVMGGWRLDGGTNRPVWPGEGFVLDLGHPGAGWKSIPQPFRRRALALAAVDTRVVCIGGMNEDNQPTLAVEVYDTATGRWAKGPELPPGRHRGFSCSAIAQGGRVYANTFQGDLLRLAPDLGSWEVVGRLRHPRLAHRIVPAGATQLIALGGEDGEDKRPELELLTPLPRGVVSAVGSPDLSRLP